MGLSAREYRRMARVRRNYNFIGAFLVAFLVTASICLGLLWMYISPLKSLSGNWVLSLFPLAVTWFPACSWVLRTCDSLSEESQARILRKGYLEQREREARMYRKPYSLDPNDQVFDPRIH